MTGPVAVVFDFDGVLVDTEPVWDAAAMRVAEQSGHAWPQRLKRLTVGLSLDATVRLLAAHVARPPREVKAGLLSSFLQEWEAERRQPMPGVRELLGELHGTVPVGVASNTPAWLVNDLLVQLSLNEAFQAVVAAPNEVLSKPDPHVYVRACDMLRSVRSMSWAVEDSALGAQAALAAEMRLLVVGPEQEGFPAPTRTVQSLLHVAADELRR